MVNQFHVLLFLPDLLEPFATEFACQLFLVNFPFLFQVNVFDVSSDVVGVKEAFAAELAFIVALASVGFPGKVQEL